MTANSKDRLERKVFSLWAHISRAEDVPECWVAYCPEFDVMSTGDSPSNALAMVREAVSLVIGADLNEGFDPTARRASSDEDWAPLHALFERHMKLTVSEINNAAQQFTQFAVPFTLTFVCVNHGQMTLGKGPTLEWALSSEKLELPEAALAKMQELVETPTKPSERLQAAAKRHGR